MKLWGDAIAILHKSDFKLKSAIPIHQSVDYSNYLYYFKDLHGAQLLVCEKFELNRVTVLYRTASAL